MYSGSHAGFGLPMVRYACRSGPSSEEKSANSTVDSLTVTFPMTCLPFSPSNMPDRVAGAGWLLVIGASMGEDVMGADVVDEDDAMLVSRCRYGRQQKFEYRSSRDDNGIDAHAQGLRVVRRQLDPEPHTPPGGGNGPDDEGMPCAVGRA